MSEQVIPVPAATIIVVRDSVEGPEVLLVKRHGRSGFMADQFVFPGGKIDEADEDDAELAAIREVFEESGILLVQGEMPTDREQWRRRLAANELSFNEMLDELALTPDHEALHYWGCWTTPSIEKRRFAAQFYLAVTPPNQQPSLDDKEITDLLWATPAAALARNLVGDLPLPPPQLQTLTAMSAMSGTTVETLIDTLNATPRSRAPIMPRPVLELDPFTLLFPWDPEYLTAGSGESSPISDDHSLVFGPSRVSRVNGYWKLTPGPA